MSKLSRSALEHLPRSLRDWISPVGLTPPEFRRRKANQVNFGLFALTFALMFAYVLVYANLRVEGQHPESKTVHIFWWSKEAGVELLLKTLEILMHGTLLALIVRLASRSLLKLGLLHAEAEDALEKTA